MSTRADSRPTSRTALVTGASSGFGFELARLLARDRYNLVMIARNRQKLEEAAAEISARYNVSAHVIAKDLAQPDAPDQIFREVQDAGIAIDVLVNNAGFAGYGDFSESDTQHLLQMMQVNIVALTHLTRLFLPHMVEQGSGRIINMASLAAFVPGPLMAVYYASKAYVLSFSEALENELAGTGVQVSVLCPGPTRTGFQERAQMEQSKLVAGDIMDVRTAARQVYRSVKKNQVVVVPGLSNKLFVFALRFLPRALATRLIRNAQESTSA